MKKDTLIGTILIVVIMIWWFASSSANNEAARAAQLAKKAAADSVAALQAEKSGSANSLVLPVTGNTELKAAPVLGGASAEAASAEVAADSSAKDAAEAAPAKIEQRTVTVENDKFIMTLTNKGAKIQSVIVKALADSAGKFPELIQDTTLGALDLKLGPVDLSEVLFDAGSAPEKIVVDNEATVEFVFADVNGNKVIRSFGFTKNGAAVRQVNKFVGFRVNDYELVWKGGMKETEELPKGSTVNAAGYFFSEVVYNNTDYVERETVGDSWTLNDGKLLWAGLRRKYAAMTVQFDAPTRAVVEAKKFKVMDSESDPGTYRLTVKDELRADSLAYNFIVLPLQWDEIEEYGVGYEKIIATGSSWFPGSRVWFVWICKVLLKLLNLFYSMIPNYGVAIILITVLVRGITTPFTVKQLKSTAAMSKLKPQLDEINVKYRSDPQKKQAAIMELYQKEGVNPMASCTGGCLPMLFQMPVFMGLFFVLGRAVELRGMPAFLWITDLSRSDVIIEAIKIPFLMPNGITLLPIIMLVTMVFQTKVTMQGNAGMDPAQQKMMMWMMPAMMFLFSAVMPSGLVLYWTISNVWTIVQYKILHRNMDNNSTPKTVKGKKVQDAQIVK
ncbi:MAG: membrane protein insertase YidC [Fibrobacter sp.]|nr:membrane protein insertase YidC [Fibrobacter sp.]